MADLKISELAALAGGDLVAGDQLAIADTSASETKRITVTDLVGNATTLIADATIPSAKILFNSSSIVGSALQTGSVDTAQLADDAVTSAKIADETTVDLVTTLPASGAFVGQLALDTDDNKVYCWDGSAWLSFKAAGSINTVVGDTAGIVNLTVATAGDQVTITTSLDNSTTASQFLAGPTVGAGAMAYRQIASADLPTATTTGKGAVQVNGQGLTMSGDQIVIDNNISSSGSTYSLVQYSSKGIVTDGRAITGADLPISTSVDLGGAKAGSGLTVAGDGAFDHANSVAPGTATKVSFDAQGHISSTSLLEADDIPDIPATKLTSGLLSVDRVADNAIPGVKLADNATALFGDTQPVAEYDGQLFFNSVSRDLFIYAANAWQPIGISVGEIVFAGTFDASLGGGTGLVSSVTSEGTAIGLTAGGVLPAATEVNKRYYVVVSEPGTITSGSAPNVPLSPPDILLSDGSSWVEIDVSQTVTAQVASNISFSPSGDISATNVQSAIEEVDNEKLPLAGGTMTGDLQIGTSASLVFEGASANDFETSITVVDPTADRTITFPNVSGTVITTGDTGSVTSAMIADGAIVNGDISASAEIAVSKLADGAARQLLQTDAAGTGVEWTSNVDIPGTLDVTGAAVFDSTARFIGNVTLDGTLIFEGATADDFETTLTVVDPTADRTITLPDATTTVAGLAVTQSYTKAQRGAVVALTDAATITPDFANGNNFSVTLAGNRTLANPSNLTAGQSGVIVVTQDGTGSRTLAFGSYWKFAGGTAPTLTTTASAVDVIAYYVESATRITAQVILNVS